MQTPPIPHPAGERAPTTPANPAATEGHAADRLLRAIQRRRAPVCIGLDPVAEKLPTVIRRATSGDDAVAHIEEFSQGVLEAVAEHAPSIKFQSACFERYGSGGVAALERLLGRAAGLGMQVILDAKRGDIGVSAEHYAAAAFDRPSAMPDWLTINSFLGRDAIVPFLRPGRGAFALVRTSNDGGDAIQAALLNDGRSVAELVASVVADAGDASVGENGYSALGAVVGATKSGAAARLRRIMPRQIFLVPGYGAQGGGVDDVLPCFNSDGRGAVVTASRSVIYAFKPGDAGWQRAVADAAARFADDLGRAVGLR